MSSISKYYLAWSARVRAALTHLPKVEEKKMCRGVTFMVNGKMCISVSDNEMMCRIDPALHVEAIKKNGCHTLQMKGRDYKEGVYINEEGMKTKKDFDYRISLAIDFNKVAKASPKKKRYHFVRSSNPVVIIAYLDYILKI